MKEIRYSGQFKKDLKRFRHDILKLTRLHAVVELLKNEQPLPQELKAHMLKGRLKGYMECHIENDLLLLWYDEDSDTIVLARLGSHSFTLGL